MQNLQFHLLLDTFNLCLDPIGQIANMGVDLSMGLSTVGQYSNPLACDLSQTQLVVPQKISPNARLYLDAGTYLWRPMNYHMLHDARCWYIRLPLSVLASSWTIDCLAKTTACIQSIGHPSRSFLKGLPLHQIAKHLFTIYTYPALRYHVCFSAQ